ncbi:MAG: sulfotransferase [Solirubrobacterales bacterium]|nr:sulfotransferase [Thermoleophilales bacterium]MCO5327065.1 sulfotransferase [Solirubrobacterales bacterium]
MSPRNPKSLWESRRRQGAAAGRTPAPFVVGVNRSGTTLLRMMLDAHPDLTIPPETHFVPELIETAEDGATTPEALLATITSQREWGDFGLSEEELLARFEALDPLTAGGALREFYGAYAERIGKPRWGEKTPIYVKSMWAIQSALPEARFVHVIRDGRDVALSIRDRATKEHPIDRIAERWVRRITRARAQAKRLDYYKEIRYEALILDTEPTLREILEFFALPWDDAVLDYHQHSAERLEEMKRELPDQGKRTVLSVERRMMTHARTTEKPDPRRVSRWREHMDRADRELFESIAGDLLRELGYATGDGPDTEPRTAEDQPGSTGEDAAEAGS